MIYKKIINNISNLLKNNKKIQKIKYRTKFNQIKINQFQIK